MSALGTRADALAIRGDWGSPNEGEGARTMKHPIEGGKCIEKGCGKTVSRKWFLDPMTATDCRCYEHGLAWKRTQRQLHTGVWDRRERLTAQAIAHATNPHWQRHRGGEVALDDMTARYTASTVRELQQAQAQIRNEQRAFQVPVQWRMNTTPPRYVMRPEDDPDGGQS